MLQSSGRVEQQPAQEKGPEAKGAQQRTVVALKGQLLHWRLLVANAGQLHPTLLVALLSLVISSSSALFPCTFLSLPSSPHVHFLTFLS